MSDNTQKPACLDCIREVREGKRSVTKVRQRGSSYCGEHVYARSKASRSRSVINVILRLIKSEDLTERDRGIAELNKEDKYLLPKIPDDILFEYAEQYRNEAKALAARISADSSLVADIGARRPYVNSVYKYLWTAFVLEQRRLPTQHEDARLKYQEADPFFERDLAQEESRHMVAPISAPQQWGPA